MRGFLHLFRRDLTQRWPLFVASFMMGLFILAVPYLPGSRVSPAELRAAAGLVAALCWCTILAILLGGSIFTRDLVEGRLAFDFRLPVRPTAIWAARLLAALTTLALAAALLLAAPAAAGMDFAGAAAGFDLLIGTSLAISVRSAMLVVPLLFVALLALSNPVALGTRTRRGWIGVDLISLGAASAAALWSLQLLRFWGARESIWRTFILLAAATALGGAIASLRQLRTGRTETDRAQRSLSLTFLFASLFITCALVGFVRWLVRPPIRSLWADQAFASSLGPDWVLVSGRAGRAPDIPMRFLLQAGTGRSLLLGPIAQWFDLPSPFLTTSANSSLDGRTIVVWELDPGAAGSLRLHKLATDAQSLVATPTPITADRSAERWALSPNGRSIAMVERTGTNQDPKRLVVYTILTGAIEDSIPIPACQQRGNILFASSREVLVPCDGWPRLATTDEEKRLLRVVLEDEVGRLLRVDLAQKTVTGDKLIHLGPPPNEALSGLIRGSAGWFAVEKASTSAADRSWQLVELESRRTVMTFLAPPAGAADIKPAGVVLRDGRLVLTWSDQETSGLQVFDVNGTLARDIPLPPGADLRILAEASDASLLVCSRRPGSRAWNLLQALRTVDLDSGEVRQLASWALVPRLEDRSSPRSVFLSRSSRLEWFDPRSKVLKPLFSDEQYAGDRETAY